MVLYRCEESFIPRARLRSSMSDDIHSAAHSRKHVFAGIGVNKVRLAQPMGERHGSEVAMRLVQESSRRS